MKLSYEFDPSNKHDVLMLGCISLAIKDYAEVLLKDEPASEEPKEEEAPTDEEPAPVAEKPKRTRKKKEEAPAPEAPVEEKKEEPVQGDLPFDSEIEEKKEEAPAEEKKTMTQVEFRAALAAKREELGLQPDTDKYRMFSGYLRTVCQTGYDTDLPSKLPPEKIYQFVTVEMANTIWDEEHQVFTQKAPY